MKGKDFLGIRYLTRDDVENVLKLSFYIKHGHRDVSEKLKGRKIISIFFESSTRTRTSFEIAAKNMGASVVNIDYHQSSMVKGETHKDTIVNLTAMKPDCFVVRNANSGYPVFIKQFTDVPVINAGDGLCEHPSQAILDLLTMYEVKSRIDNLKVCIIGDILHSRVAKSHIHLSRMLNWQISLYGPKTMLPREEWLSNIKIEKNLKEALHGKDFIIFLRIQLERKSGEDIPSLQEYSRHFGISSPSALPKDTYVMHPGPVNRNVELSSEVIDHSGKSLIINQVENSIYTRMAIYSFCLNLPPEEA